MSRHDSDAFNEYVVFEERHYLLTRHVRERMEERDIRSEWVQGVLRTWVARKYNAKNDSMNYFGFVTGQSYLLMVAVSDRNSTIPTVFSDADATEAYTQGDYDYFDEVR